MVNERQKKWVKEHPDRVKEARRKFYLTHLEQEKARTKKYRLEHSEQYIKLWKKYHNAHPEIQKKHIAKRNRNLGFIPLNNPLNGTEAHHIDKVYVIYIPEKLHESIPHNIWTGRGMAKINALALEYLSTNILAQSL